MVDDDIERDVSPGIRLVETGDFEAGAGRAGGSTGCMKSSSIASRGRSARGVVHDFQLAFQARPTIVNPKGGAFGRCETRQRQRDQ